MPQPHISRTRKPSPHRQQTPRNRLSSYWITAANYIFTDTPTTHGLAFEHRPGKADLAFEGPPGETGPTLKN